MRRGKQVIYGFIYLVFWCAVAGAIYLLFLRNPPAVRVAGCGSECIPTSTQPIAVLGNVQIFSSGPGSQTFLAQVGNPNPDAAAQAFAYTFDFNNASGIPVQVFSGESFLYAGELKYLLVPNAVVASSVQSVSLSIGSTTWVNPSALGGVPKLAFQNVSTVIAGGTTATTGEITDQDISSFNNIFIIAVFENASGTPIGASQTELNSIAPDQLESFSIMYPALPNADAAHTQLFVYAARP